MSTIAGDRTDWRYHAACQDVDPDLWYAADGDHETRQAAVRICENYCPVKEQCLAEGMSEDFGIWGGKTARQRRQMRRNRRKAPAVGVIRRLRALTRNGWGPAEIAAQIRYRSGVQLSVANLRRLTQDDTVMWVHEDTAKQVALVYDEMSTGRSTNHHAARRIAEAAAADWPAPSAWKGVDIDDPWAAPAIDMKGQQYLFAPDATVPTVGAVRRLRALAGLGYGPTQLAEILRDRGHRITHGTVASLLDGAIGHTTLARHAAIRDLYDDLAVGPRSTSPRAHLTIGNAHANGWPDPGDWAGVDIDDPTAAPLKAA